MSQTNYTQTTVESKVKHDRVRQICDSLPKKNTNGEAQVIIKLDKKCNPSSCHGLDDPQKHISDSQCKQPFTVREYSSYRET